jgi:hypothetical protein
MSAIRPDLPAIPPSTGAAPAVRAAQADFFRAALAQVQTAASSQGSAQAIRPATTPITTEPARAPTDARPARPGSLLDIRV